MKAPESQKLKTVAFRADCNETIGFGHVSRCLAIARQIREQFDCLLFIQNPPENIREKCEAYGVHFHCLEAGLSKKDEVEYLNATLEKLKVDMICLDGYTFDEAYQNELKSTDIPITIIDDLKSPGYCADLIINHAPGTQKSDYLEVEGCRYFLGLDALMLAPEFWEQTPRDSDGSGFICLGGSDPRGATSNAIERLATSGLTLNVVIGGLNPRSEALIERFRSHSGIQFYYDLSPAEISELMARSQFGVCASSTIALEYLVVGRELYLMKTADNQAGIYKGLLEEKLAVPFEDYPSPSSYSPRKKMQCPDFTSLFMELLK